MAESFWREIWLSLSRRPQFMISAALIVFIILVAVFPSLFTAADPRYANPDQSLLSPRQRIGSAPTCRATTSTPRTIYGARASITVGLGATLLVFVVGGALGALAGFYGGWLDAVVSRVADVFFGIPLLLAAIVLMQVMHHRTVWTVVAILALFGWPQSRGSPAARYSGCAAATMCWRRKHWE